MMNNQGDNIRNLTFLLHLVSVAKNQLEFLSLVSWMKYINFEIHQIPNFLLVTQREL